MNNTNFNLNRLKVEKSISFLEGLLVGLLLVLITILVMTMVVSATTVHIDGKAVEVCAFAGYDVAVVDAYGTQYCANYESLVEFSSQD